jgi:hypothetical protein
MTAAALSRPKSRKRARTTGITGQLMRAAGLILGLLVILLGIIIAPLPGPMGVPVMAVGLVLVLRASPGAKRLFVRAHRRWPQVINPVRRLLRPNAPILPILWEQTVRLGRLLLQVGARLVTGMAGTIVRWLRAGVKASSEPV